MGRNQCILFPERGYCQCLKCNRMQGNAVPPPPIYGLKRSPTSCCHNARERHVTTDMGPKPECIVPPPIILHFNHWVLHVFKLYNVISFMHPHFLGWVAKKFGPCGDSRCLDCQMAKVQLPPYLVSGNVVRVRILICAIRQTLYRKRVCHFMVSRTLHGQLFFLHSAVTYHICQSQP